MNETVVAAVQMRMTADPAENLARAEAFVRAAAEQGANIVLLPELFERPYFCQQRRYDYLDFALPVSENPAVSRMRSLANELGVVIPVSFYERDGNRLYNACAMVDASGELLGVYRKTHIPDDHFYQEKFYFSPGDTGFRVFETKFGRVGVGICWDQWFPEAARAMALLGADLLLYPTAIGSEPILDCDSMPHWRRAMQGHAAANIVPVAAANRVGMERVEPCAENGMQQSALTFYGSSFLTDETGEVLQQADRTSETVISARYDFARIRRNRLDWGLFRDRRPECYELLTR
ncbi:MAG: N-carbamoylputrescine amidase [Clostridiales bacterium]|nr:N-carbamoylputrescine amidase [Clostridiales bacterium]